MFVRTESNSGSDDSTPRNSDCNRPNSTYIVCRYKDHSFILILIRTENSLQHVYLKRNKIAYMCITFIYFFSIFTRVAECTCSTVSRRLCILSICRFKSLKFSYADVCINLHYVIHVCLHDTACHILSRCIIKALH